MADLSDLENRIRFFGIDEPTRRVVREVRPYVLAYIETIVDKFYDYARAFPDADSILEPYYQSGALRQKQVRHWEKLFSCDFDEEFLEYGRRIGRAHFDKRVYPYLYIGGYNYVQCALLEVVERNFTDQKTRTAVLTAINRLIAFDIDLALSAYTREYWLRKSDAGLRAPEMTANPSEDVAGNIEFVC